MLSTIAPLSISYLSITLGILEARFWSSLPNRKHPFSCVIKFSQWQDTMSKHVLLLDHWTKTYKKSFKRTTFDFRTPWGAPRPFQLIPEARWFQIPRCKVNVFSQNNTSVAVQFSDRIFSSFVSNTDKKHVSTYVELGPQQVRNNWPEQDHSLQWALSVGLRGALVEVAADAAAARITLVGRSAHAAYISPAELFDCDAVAGSGLSGIVHLCMQLGGLPAFDCEGCAYEWMVQSGELLNQSGSGTHKAHTASTKLTGRLVRKISTTPFVVCGDCLEPSKVLHAISKHQWIPRVLLLQSLYSFCSDQWNPTCCHLHSRVENNTHMRSVVLFHSLA